MSQLLKIAFIALVGTLSSLMGEDAVYKPVSPHLDEFLKTYCIDCHGEVKQKRDRRLDQLMMNRGEVPHVNVNDEFNMNLLMDTLDQLNLGEMPPDKK